MARLNFEQTQRGQIRVDRREDGGELLGRVTSSFRNESDFVDAATTLGIDRDTLMRYLDEFERSGNSGGSYEITTTAARVEIFGKSMTDKDETSVRYIGEGAEAAVKAALNGRELAGATNPFLYWRDATQLCAVDLDIKEKQRRWTEIKLTSLLESFNPQPFCSWITHGGGLRLLYHALSSLTAEEIAAVAYLNLSQSQTYESLELKLATRHPCYPRESQRCSQPKFQAQTFDGRSLRRWLRQYSVDDPEIRRWLTDHGLEADKRYEHDRCPGQPTVESHGTPIHVGDQGVFCFACEARGITVGSSRAGFYPYGYLIGDSTATLLFYVFDGLTHWEHARMLLESSFEIAGKYARLVYSAGLKVHHGADDPRVGMVFSTGRDLIRIDRRWTNLNGDPYTKDLGPILERLPACCSRTARGICPDQSKVALFQQAFDLTRYGYPPLTPIFGMKIGTLFLEASRRNDAYIVVQTPDLARENMTKYRPRYVPETTRMQLPDAWAAIEEVCPGVNRQLVYALIAAKGVAEAEVSMPPMIFITGPTGTAKSSTITLAAAMCGDSNAEIVWTANIERVRQAIGDSKDTGSFVTFNEILKESISNARSPVQAMDFILNLTPGSVSHKMWVGPTRLGSLPVFTWTDTAIPHELTTDAQLARRLVHIHLPTTLDWRSSLKRTVGQLRNLRLGNELYADASNAIVSYIIDRFFRERFTFEEICKELGFYTLASSADAEDNDEILKDFFKAVCNAPKLKDSDAVRWKGRGFKVVNRGDENHLLDLWLQLCDENSGGKFVASRRCTSCDWQKLIGTHEPVELEIRNHGQMCVAIRFINVNRTRLSYIVNEELVAPSVNGEMR